jgi:membrane protein implicated in regulation of membrane protease activity
MSESRFVGARERLNEAAFLLPWVRVLILIRSNTLPIPIWLLFLFLCIAAFAPAASYSSRWLLAYYCVLLMCWVLVTVAGLRLLGRQDREQKRKLNRMLRQFRDRGRVTEMKVDAVPRGLGRVRRRIIVAADLDLYDAIRSDQVADESAIIIRDRRGADRRHRRDLYAVERRRTERRGFDIRPLLLSQGWAEVNPLTGESEELTP